MNIIEKQIVKRYHSYCLETNPGNPPKAQGWTSKTAQQSRFDVLLSLLDFNGKSILDVGCGCGDFKARLDEKFHDFDYIGLDQQTEFIEYAQKRYQSKSNTWFYEVDFSRCQLPKVDIVVASGVLSYFSKNSNYYFEMIQHFYEAAEHAFIFNMLDQSVFDSGPLLVGHDKDKIYDLCKGICPNTSLKTGYLPDDFTIIMKKR